MQDFLVDTNARRGHLQDIVQPNAMVSKSIILGAYLWGHWNYFPLALCPAHDVPDGVHGFIHSFTVNLRSAMLVGAAQAAATWRIQADPLDALRCHATDPFGTQRDGRFGS